MNKELLQLIINSHAAWIRDSSKGIRADLQDADLRGADLRHADLRNADLQGADLQGADLQDADLRGAYLRGADLQGADLQDANLQGADLRHADLRHADLSHADLSHASLQNADLRDAKLPDYSICPEEGSFIAWKKADGAVLKLRIPENARRTSSLVGRKCRVSEAHVLAAYHPDPNKTMFPTRNRMVYVLGMTHMPDSFDDDIRVECTHGIHVFMTRKEAENWQY